MVPKYPEEKVPLNGPVNHTPITHPKRASHYAVALQSLRDSDPRARQRGWVAKAAFVVTTLWIVYIIYLTIGKHRGSREGFYSFKSFEGHGAFLTQPPFPPDVNISSCANWTDNFISSGNFRGASSSSVTFELPLSSEKLFLLSRGVAAGMIAMVSTNESMDSARVQIVASYRHSRDLGGARVCSINRGDKERGVGIFTRPWPKRDYVHYTIIVYFPVTSKTQPLRIKNFETDLPFFSHSISRLADVVHFDTLTLTTSMMPIDVASLSATKALVKTSHAKIEGTFNTSSALELSTFNAPIKVNIGLSSKGTADKTRLNMNTNRGPITAAISLISTIKTRGQFNVSATTSLDALDLTFTEAPVDSTLSLNARSSFAPVTVRLHETYEGTIKAVTSLSRAEVVVDESVKDPAGRGRTRMLYVREMGKSRIWTSVAWIPGVSQQGSVNVETSMESATIKL